MPCCLLLLGQGCSNSIQSGQRQFFSLTQVCLAQLAMQLAIGIPVMPIALLFAASSETALWALKMKGRCGLISKPAPPRRTLNRNACFLSVCMIGEKPISHLRSGVCHCSLVCCPQKVE